MRQVGQLPRSFFKSDIPLGFRIIKTVKSVDTTLRICSKCCNMYRPWIHIIRLKHLLKTYKRRFLVKDQRDAQIPFYVFIFIYNSLHVSSTSCSSSWETNCVNTTSGWEWTPFTPNLHTTRPPTRSDSYQRLYWHNLSLLMMNTRCSKHVQSYK